MAMRRCSIRALLAGIGFLGLASCTNGPTPTPTPTHATSVAPSPQGGIAVIVTPRPTGLDALGMNFVERVCGRVPGDGRFQKVSGTPNSVLYRVTCDAETRLVRLRFSN